MRRFSVRIAAGLVAVGTVIPAAVAAQGYSVYTQGTCTMSRAGAAVASPCTDGSAIFYNPAAITNEPGVVAAGVTLIRPTETFTDRLTGQVSETVDATYPVPHFYVTKGFGERFAAGIGLFAPYGLTTEWDPDSSQGRFLGYRSKVAAIYIQPTVAYEVAPWLSVGAGFNLSRVSVGLRQRLDLSQQQAAPGVTFANLGIQAGTDFADANLESSTWTKGYHLGLQVRPTRGVSIGARYLSRQLAEFDEGTVEFTPVETGLVLAPNNPLGLPGGTPVDLIVASQFTGDGLLAEQGAHTFLRLPEQLVVGVAVEPLERVKLLFDYQYTNWSVFEELPITFERLGRRVQAENYENTHGFRVGAEYGLGTSSALRAGYYTHGAAAPDETVTPLLPEAARASFTVGFGTRLGVGLGIDLAYQYIDAADRIGRTVPEGPTPAATIAANNGIYTGKSHLFAATLSYDF
jgi:long-chain fatty acid transport protein